MSQLETGQLKTHTPETGQLKAGGSIQRAFVSLPDPRARGGKRHNLAAMLTIAVCAVICGSASWTDIAEFGRAKKEWFESFLHLPHGIPSHDTFGRVFAIIEPEAFERCFGQWVKGLVKAGKGTLVGIDGKTLKHSFDKAAGKAAIQGEPENASRQDQDAHGRGDRLELQGHGRRLFSGVLQGSRACRDSHMLVYAGG